MVFTNAKMQLNEYLCCLVDSNMICFQEIIELFSFKKSASHLV